MVEALADARRTRGSLDGAVFHSDNGSQYTSLLFRQYCDSQGVLRSRGKVGTSADNALAESFHASLKREVLGSNGKFADKATARAEPLENLGADYDVDDLLPPIRAGLTYEGKLYAAPFYGESSMIMYRKDLFEAAGITMPDSPTWDSGRRRCAKAHRQEQGNLRHLPARQGRLGREHGLPDRHVELLRRALVRRELEAAIRPAGRGRTR